MNLKEFEDRTSTYLNLYIEPCRVKCQCLNDTDLKFEHIDGYERKHNGKVRDSYIFKDFVVIITTDRQSAFDRQLASIPFKGQVLNLTSKWWFDQTKSIVPNHIISCPHPNVTIGRRCQVFSVEFVMRGYITGTTNTSLWTNYANGVRNYCGHIIPEGLKKNQVLESNLLTPTTKDNFHDELISAEEIIRTGRMSQEDWKKCADYAHQLFSFGQQKALERGLILVDTKYEFGKDSNGNILLIDEIQTPDSSRYWIASTYQDRFNNGQEPENVDKEFLRKWFVSHCDPYRDEKLPDAPADLVNELSRRYVMLFEIITGDIFDFSVDSKPESISNALKEFFHQCK